MAHRHVAVLERIESWFRRQSNDFFTSYADSFPSEGTWLEGIIASCILLAQGRTNTGALPTYEADKSECIAVRRGSFEISVASLKPSSGPLHATTAGNRLWIPVILVLEAPSAS